MDRLRKVAKVLSAHGQHDLAREVAEVSLQVKQASTPDDKLVRLLGEMLALAQDREQYSEAWFAAYERHKEPHKGSFDPAMFAAGQVGNWSGIEGLLKQALEYAKKV